MELIYKEEAYELVGICMEVHNELGCGLLEMIYKEALEYELAEKDILYRREQEFAVKYKKIFLQKRFHADFTVYDKIILEIKARQSLSDADIAQTLNYLKLSNYKLGLLVNFGKTKLEVKRIVL